MSDVHQLSRQAYARLQAEYEDLTTRGRIQIAQAIERARELGDLSENGDYHAAKDQQGLLEARIRELEAILENVEFVDDAVEGQVSAGSIVTIRYADDAEDAAETYLLGHIEEKGEYDVISPTSPLGAALIGKQVGDEVEYDAPGGVLKVIVLKSETG
jgi:transcription elongation factor GreA